MSLHGLLLAAGAGTRMGTPKALVHDQDGTSWLARAAVTLRKGGCDEVTVVLGAEAGSAVPLLAGTDATVVIAEDWAEGIAASLRSGLRSLSSSDAEAAVVSLVDLPDVSADVIRRVTDLGTDRGVLARAAYDGRPGHPVLIGRDHWEALAASVTGDTGARDYLAQHDVFEVECGDLATGRDRDRP